MRKRLRTRQAVLPMLVKDIPMKFACQAALLPSALLAAGFLREFNIAFIFKLFKVENFKNYF